MKHKNKLLKKGVNKLINKPYYSITKISYIYFFYKFETNHQTTKTNIISQTNSPSMLTILTLLSAFVRGSIGLNSEHTLFTIR